VCACVCIGVCACVRVEGIVDILLDGGSSVNVRNRKNQLPRQLTHNMNILSKLSMAVQHQTQTQRITAACTTRNTAVSHHDFLYVCPVL